MNQLEREVIILYSAWSMIDSMVNWAIFGNLSPDFCDPTEYKTNLKFEGRAEGKIFLIQLRDFLSEVQHYKNKSSLGLKKAPPKPSPSNKTFLFHLREVCESPQLGKNAIELSRKVEDFGKWLEGEFCHNGDWLPPEIKLETEICVSHYRYITMLGDIAKHHLGRLTATTDHLHDLLVKSKCEIDKKESYLLIHDFNEFFHGIFESHAPMIASFLNNIRWEIHLYLENSPTDFQYRYYHVPPGINDPIAQEMYLKLMNKFITRPFMSPDQIIKW